MLCLLDFFNDWKKKNYIKFWRFKMNLHVYIEVFYGEEMGFIIWEV